MAEVIEEFEVTIKRKCFWKEKKTKNFTVEKTPTGIKKETYGGGSEVAYHEKFATKEVEEAASSEDEIFTQCVKGEDFDLKKVIQAINGLV